MAVSVDNHFYVDLVSNVNDYGIANTIGNFRTKIAQTVTFGEEEWEVGLSEIIFTKTWCNIQSKQIVWLISSEGQVFENPYFIEPGFYENITDLLKEVNAHLIESFLQYVTGYEIDTTVRPPILKYNNRTKLVNIETGEYTQIRTQRKIKLLPFIGQELQGVLGLNLKYQSQYENNISKSRLKFKNLKHIGDLIKGSRPVDLSRGTTAFFVYCDIIKPSLVGDTYAQLLRVVSIPKVAFGETIHKSFDLPHYYPLATSSFNSIEIDAKDEVGETIRFKGGRVYIKLHFRRK